MDNYTLNREELNEFLEIVVYNKDVKTESLKKIIEAARNWETNCCGLTYFLGQLIQKKINAESLEIDFLNSVYALCEQLYFSVSEVEQNFINYILSHDRLMETNYTLEEILVLLNTYYMENYYGRIVSN